MTQYLFSVVVLACAAVVTGGCASYAPGEPDTINDRLRPGPGLISGEDGVFLLFDGPGIDSSR